MSTEQQPPATIVVAIVACACFVFLIAYSAHRPYNRPLAVRTAATLCLLVGLAHASRLFLLTALEDQTLYRLVTEEFPAVLASVLLCVFAARSVAKDTPRLRSFQLSSVAVLSGAWVVSLVIGLRFPIPAFYGPLYDAAPMPPQFLALKSVNAFYALYTFVLAILFFRKGFGASASTRKQRLQNSCFGLGSLAWSLNGANAYVWSVSRVVAKTGILGVVRYFVVTEITLVVTCALSLATGFALYCSRTRRDRIISVTLKWLDLRHQLETRLREFPTKGAFASSLTAISLKKAGESQNRGGLGLTPADIKKAEYTARLVQVLVSDDGYRKLAYHLSVLQARLLEDEQALRLLLASLDCPLCYGPEDDLLHHALRPAIELADLKRRPDLIGAPEWRQLAAVAAIDSLTDSKIFSPEEGERILRNSVTGHVLGTYRDSKRILLSDESNIGSITRSK